LLIATYIIALVDQLLHHWDNIAWVIGLIGAGVIYYAIVTRSMKRSGREGDRGQ
jgi:hypothetical protein